MEHRWEVVFNFLSEGSYPSTFTRGQRQTLRKFASKFSIHAGHLFFGASTRRRAIQSREEACNLFKEFHVSPTGQHIGIVKTRNAMCSQFYWIGMTSDIDKWVSQCDNCKRVRPRPRVVKKLDCNKVNPIEPQGLILKKELITPMDWSASPLTTRVLNTAAGVPGSNMPLRLYQQDPWTNVWNLISNGTTDDEGRCPGLITQQQFRPAVYKLHFETAQYWENIGETSFYPYVEIVFTITNPDQKYHVPLLMSRFSYSTYI